MSIHYQEPRWSFAIASPVAGDRELTRTMAAIDAAIDVKDEAVGAVYAAFQGLSGPNLRFSDIADHPRWKTSGNYSIDSTMRYTMRDHGASFLTNDDGKTEWTFRGSLVSSLVSLVDSCSARDLMPQWFAKGDARVTVFDEDYDALQDIWSAVVELCEARNVFLAAISEYQAASRSFSEFAMNDSGGIKNLHGRLVKFVKPRGTVVGKVVGGRGKTAYVEVNPLHWCLPVTVQGNMYNPSGLSSPLGGVYAPRTDNTRSVSERVIGVVQWSDPPRLVIPTEPEKVTITSSTEVCVLAPANVMADYETAINLWAARGSKAVTEAKTNYSEIIEWRQKGGVAALEHLRSIAGAGRRFDAVKFFERDRWDPTLSSWRKILGQYMTDNPDFGEEMRVAARDHFISSQTQPLTEGEKSLIATRPENEDKVGTIPDETKKIFVAGGQIHARMLYPTA